MNDLAELYPEVPRGERIRLVGGPLDGREVTVPDRRGGIIRMPLEETIALSAFRLESYVWRPSVAQYRERLGALGAPSRDDNGVLIFDFWRYES